MTQQDFITNLRDAKASHIKWHAKALALASGFETGEDSIPKLYTDCTFGKWYYGVGQFISDIPDFVEIEPLHTELHNTYMQIYQKYIHPVKKNIFEKRDKAEKKKQKELLELVEKLKDISTLLIQKINSVEKIIIKTDKDEFLRMVTL